MEVNYYQIWLKMRLDEPVRDAKSDIFVLDLDAFFGKCSKYL